MTVFELWLLVSALLAYAIVAYLWSPSLQQLRKEYEDADSSYRQHETAIARIGMFVNRWHFKIANNRGIIVISIAMTWLVITAIWINF